MAQEIFVPPRADWQDQSVVELVEFGRWRERLPPLQ